MFEQLAQQLQAAEGKHLNHDNLVPFLVLMSFLLTAWLVYFGVIDDIIYYFDLQPSAYAGTVDLYPAVQLNGYTFDHELNPDLYYTQGYGYPQ